MCGRFYLRDGLGDKVLVLHGGDRVMNTHHRADFVDTITTRIDHDLAANVAAVGMHRPAVIGVLSQIGNRCVAVDSGSRKTGSASKRLTKLCRIYIAIHRIPEPTQEILGGQQRMPARTFLGIDDLKIHPHALGHTGEMSVTIHLLWRVRQTYTAIRVVIIDGVFRIVRQLLVQVDRMGLEAHHGLSATKVGDLSSGMPGCARCQLITLDQYHIRPALLSQVVQGGATGNTTTDNNNTGLAFHGAANLERMALELKINAPVGTRPECPVKYFRTL